MLLTAVKLAGLVLTAACCWLASRTTNLALIWGAPILTIPVAALGRHALDAAASKKRVEWADVIVHCAMMMALGAGIFPAVKLARIEPGMPVPFPRTLGFALFAITGTTTALTVLNLAIRGFGAPFAAKLSSRLATDWMYGWTRNPMLLATLFWFFSIGLWQQSLWFLAWVAVSVAPGWIAFIKIYEERELELRFGPGYLEYKERTSFLWPRRPRRS